MSKKSCKEAIVVFNGCFCPVHAGHVKALLDTKRKMEAGGKFKVVAGYFAVATDGYVRRKLEGPLQPWMTAASRVDMCNAVARDVSWNVSAAEFAGAKQCGKAMIAQYHSKETEIISVRDEIKNGGISKKGNGEFAELSSTGIRAKFTKWGCTHEVIDGLVGQRVLGGAVGECLKQKLRYTKKVDCICCEGTGKLLGMACPLCDGLGRFDADSSEGEWTAAAMDEDHRKQSKESDRSSRKARI